MPLIRLRSSGARSDGGVASSSFVVTTPGFVVAVKAFLEANPKANLEQILKGLGGNLCRCGTYVGIQAAALECAGHGKEG